MEQIEFSLSSNDETAVRVENDKDPVAQYSILIRCLWVSVLTYDDCCYTSTLHQLCIVKECSCSDIFLNYIILFLGTFLDCLIVEFACLYSILSFRWKLCVTETVVVAE